MLPFLKLYYKNDLIVLRVPYFWNYINFFFMILLLILSFRDEIMHWISYILIVICFLSLSYQEKWVYQKRVKILVYTTGFLPFLKKNFFSQSDLKEIYFLQVGRFYLIKLSTLKKDWEIERSTKKNQILELALRLSKEWEIPLKK